MGQQSMKVECKTRARLTLEWREAADVYSTLETSIDEKRGQCTEEEYERLRDVAKTALSLAEQLQKDLERHIQEHGC